MNMPTEAIKRWNWLNGYCTAFLHVVLNDINLSITPSLTFCEAWQQFVHCLAKRYEDRGRPALPPVDTPTEEEIHYLFHLASELWGSDWHMYSTFFPKQNGGDPIWQTFHFAMAFYLVERWLYLFMSAEKRKASRGARRRFLFGIEGGAFSVHHRDAFACLGLPFAIVGSTQRAKGVDQ